MFKKITTGFVIQTYDDAGTCTHQEFIAGDETDIESEDGSPITENVTLAYQPFDMVQPKEGN